MLKTSDMLRVISLKKSMNRQFRKRKLFLILKKSRNRCKQQLFPIFLFTRDTKDLEQKKLDQQRRDREETLRRNEEERKR